jgi:hypothetical protein
MEIIFSAILGLFAAVLFRGAWLSIEDANQQFLEVKKKRKK